ncbi:MAG TPA: hypothetical protein VF622_04095 [Segetibacter sp.]|jgi:Leucine-rich repeat (LRR) protein
MKAQLYFSTIFFLLLFNNSNKANAQGEVWDEVNRKTNEFNSSLLRWVFDERFINDKMPRAIRIESGDSSYMHNPLISLFSVETAIIENIEEQPLEILFEKLALLPNLKHLVFTNSFFKITRNKERTAQIPGAISKLKNLESIKFKLGKEFDIEDALDKIYPLESLKYLFIEFANLSSMPKNLCRFKNLKGLSLNVNNIKTFPTCFTNLSSLRYLSFTFNEKDDSDNIFQILSGLPSLEYLLLPYSYFDSSFAGIGKLKNLKRLSATNSTIKDPNTFFHDMTQANSIRQLDISFSYCPFIPPLIGVLRQLEKLMIKGVKPAGVNKDDRLRHLPFEIGSLKNLAFLDASSNQLSNLSNSFSKLKKLEEINLQGNRFDTFPQSLTNLSNLKKVDLSYNVLAYIPEDIKHLKHLQNLHIESNKLKSLPSTLGSLNSLKFLKVSRNQLEHLPLSFGTLRNLDTVYLDDNKLQDLPEPLSALKHLTLLNLRNNYLSALPSSINDLEKLQTLDLSYNQLNHIPGTFEKLKSLKHFSAGNNNMTALPDSLGTGYKLETFYVGNTLTKYVMDYVKGKYDSSKKVAQNRLIKLPEQIPYNRNLVGVNLSNNPTLDSAKTILWIQGINAPKARVTASNCNIHHLPVSGWNKFKGEHLDLANNKIKSLPADVLSMPNIKHFTTANNFLPSVINSSFESKSELHLAMAEAAIIPAFKLSRNLLEAANKRADFYYYKNSFEKANNWYKKMEETDSAWAENNIHKRQRGEVKYFTGDYIGAIKYLSAALVKDTASGIRIINEIRPSMYYISQSYLKLKDTVKAYTYLERLSERFVHDETDIISEASILAAYYHDTAKAETFFNKVLDAYRKQRSSAGVQLSILELYTISNKPEEALKYADSMKVETLSAAEKFLFDYLYLTAALTSKKSGAKDLTLFSNKYDTVNLKMPSWSFGLFDLWRATNKSDDKTKKLIEDLNSFVRRKFEGTKVKDRVVPFFG